MWRRAALAFAGPALPRTPVLHRPTAPRVLHLAMRWLTEGSTEKAALTAEPTTAPTESVFPPSFSRRARRERLQEALAAAARGEEFVLPQPQPQSLPGPCGAVMNILRERGPLKTTELYEAVEQRYPGVVRSKTHMKQRILKSALVNKLVKVRLVDADYKDRWAIRRPGRPRMRIARERFPP